MAKQFKLRLVVSNNEPKEQKKPKEKSIFNGLKKRLIFQIPFITTKAAKIALIRIFYMKKYRIEDMKAPELISIPYFLRAEQKISEIIKENTIDFEYNKVRKLIKTL